jgi:hypothetical protein
VNALEQRGGKHDSKRRELKKNEGTDLTNEVVFSRLLESGRRAVYYYFYLDEKTMARSWAGVAASQQTSESKFLVSYAETTELI